MSSIYELKTGIGLVVVPEDTPSIPHANEPAKAQDKNESSSKKHYLRIYSFEEIDALDVADTDIRDALLHLSHAHGSFANILPNCIVGSLSFPDSNTEVNTEEHFGFYLDAQLLVFVDSTGHCKTSLENLNELKLLPTLSTARVLYELMKFYISDDPILMANIEKKLNDIEDQINEDKTAITNKELLCFRRKIMNYNRLYQQLTDLSANIDKNDYSLLDKEDRRLFRLFGQRSERLFQRTQFLEEYSLQLVQLYQLQMETQQNRAIQWFTVITTVFVPLTFITSWYGMNFHYMPELDFPYSYVIVMAVCLALVVLQLVFFKKRKWL